MGRILERIKHQMSTTSLCVCGHHQNTISQSKRACNAKQSNHVICTCSVVSQTHTLAEIFFPEEGAHSSSDEISCLRQRVTQRCSGSLICSQNYKCQIKKFQVGRTKKYNNINISFKKHRNYEDFRDPQITEQRGTFQNYEAKVKSLIWYLPDLLHYKDYLGELV